MEISFFSNAVITSIANPNKNLIYLSFSCCIFFTIQLATTNLAISYTFCALSVRGGQ